MQALEATIKQVNARFLGVDDSMIVAAAGKELASLLAVRFSDKTSFAFLAGAGNNGAIGFVAAGEMARAGMKVSVCYTGRTNKFLSETAASKWEALRVSTPSNLTLKQDCSAEDIENHQVIVDCLTEKKEEKLSKRLSEIVKRCSHFRETMVAFEFPAPGYTPDWAVSLSYPKTPEAEVITVSAQPETELYVGPGEVQALFEPNRASHKAQNGKLLIIGGAEKGLENLTLAIRAASWYVGQIFLYTGLSEDLTAKLDLPQGEANLASIEHISSEKLESTIAQSDAILIGPGWSENMPNKALLNYILATFPEKKFVLDTEAIKMVDLRLIRLMSAVLFTADRSSLLGLIPDKLTSENALTGRLKRFCLDHNCFVNLKGSSNLLFGRSSLSNSVEMRMNKLKALNSSSAVGQTSLTAGLSAALATKNDLWLSMSAAAFLERIAGDLAFREKSYLTQFSDLVEMLPQAWEMCREF